MVTLSTLKYKIDVEGLGLDPALLRAQIKAERWNGGLNLTRGRGLGGGLPDAAFDAAGNLKLKKPDDSLTDYPLTPAQFGGEQMTLTVLYKGLPVTVEKPFTPVETSPGVIDLLVLAAQGKAQTVTPEELRSVKAIAADAQAAAAEARAQGQELADIARDTAQQREAIESKTADLLTAAPLLPDAQAAAAARPDAQAAAAALPDARAAAALLPDVQAALTALGAIPTALSGLRVTATDDGYLFEADPATTTPATVQAAPLGGLLYEVI